MKEAHLKRLHTVWFYIHYGKGKTVKAVQRSEVSGGGRDEYKEHREFLEL